MFKLILLATDGSDDAREALAYTRDLALENQAKVVVVHTFPPVPAYLGDPWGERWLNQNIAEGERVAEDAAAQLREAGVEVEAEVLEGPAADAIVRVATVRDCDLIVMGSRGHGDLASLLLGSVSHRVLVHAHAPVMIVKSEGEKDRRRGQFGGEPLD